MTIEDKIAGLSVRTLVIIAIILTLLILAWQYRHAIESKFTNNQ